MNTSILLAVGAFSLVAGSILGYFIRQSVARQRADTVEQKLKQRLEQAKEEATQVLNQAKEKAKQVTAGAEADRELSRKQLLETEQILLKRESVLDAKVSSLDQKEKTLERETVEVKQKEKALEEVRLQALEKLERAAGFSKEEAKKELFELTQQQHEADLLARMRKLEQEGEERFDKRAREIVAYAVQKVGVSQAQEITTTTVPLPSEDLKGKIIGKEGRNIRALERAAGVEIIVDEVPEAVVISGFDPLRRQVARVALERLIKDGRIHPARVEEQVEKAQQEIDSQIKEAGEAVVYELGIVGLDPKLLQILGRLKFRTSYGQNVLLHSLEVAYLASGLAAELGANVTLAKKAGLFHDIGKALDHQVEGSHVEIGMRILEKFGVEKEVVDAMKSHHEDYPYESVEAILIQVADAISASRPGARKDTLENYLKRIGELENLAASFPGVEKVYAIQAGREVRVFVKPQELDDLAAQLLAREIANRIEQDLRYPGEIKVTLVRENRFVEYAR
ncbi:MAG TPA: ribonuclease Y [Candidatus Paceibacterota bacterium]